MRLLKHTLLTSIIAILAACGGTGKEISTHESSGGMKVFVPENIKQSKLPTDGDLEAFIRIDGGNRIPMQIVGIEARVTLTNVSLGEHTFEVEYIFNSGEYSRSIELSNAIKPVNVGDGTSIEFRASEYNYPDEDDDGRSNVEELDPDFPYLNPFTPNLADDESVNVTARIPDEIANADLSTQGTIRATISVSGGEEEPMTISGDSVSVSLDGLTLEEHDFKIRYYIDSPMLGDDIPLVEVDQSAIISSDSDTPDFESASSATSIDSDNDGMSNIEEVASGVNPLPANTPTPVPTTPVPATPAPVVTPVETPSNNVTPTPIVTFTPTPVVSITPTPAVTPIPQVNVRIVENFGGILLENDELTINIEFNPAITNEGTHSYQWLRDGIEIEGATQSTYTVAQDDAGTDLSVEVTPYYGNGDIVTTKQTSNTVTVNSGPTISSTVIVDVNEGTPEIDDWLLGQYAYRDTDGDPEQGTTVRWLREESPENFVTVGTTANYQITAEDSGLRLFFEVTPRASQGVIEGTATRSEALVVTDNEAPTASNVRITDEQENTLVSSVVGVTIYGAFDYNDAEGDLLDANNTQYQWLRGNEIILNENNEPYFGVSYTPTAEDSGFILHFRVIPVAENGNTIGEASSTETGIEIVNSAPNIHENSITITNLNGGTPVVGNTLSVAYEFNDRDGDSEGATTFQWLRDGTDITEEGVTSNENTYILQSNDADRAISVRITPIAVEGVATGEAVVSSAIIVGNVEPTASEVSIGSAAGDVYVVGETLTATYTYSDSDDDPEGASRFRWYRGENIIHQGSSIEFLSYTTTTADSGENISFEVVPVASSGTEQGASAAATPISINALPVATNVNISGATEGSAIVDTQLTALYTITDAEEPMETSALIEWWRIRENEDDVRVSTDSTYTLNPEDKNSEIILIITPIAATGSSPGISVATSGVVYTNSLPVADDVNIGGYSDSIVIQNTTLRADYTFRDDDNDFENTDAETGTQFRWIRPNGELQTIVGYDRTYQVQEEDSGITLELQVTPVSLDGAIGDTQIASVLVPVNTPPSVDPASIDISNDSNGEIIEGTTLTAVYEYIDTENDPEGESVYQWYRNGQAIDGANDNTYQLQQDDIEARITFSVTPVANTGIRTGDTAISPTESAPVVLRRYVFQYTANTGGTINGTSNQTVTNGYSGTEVIAEANNGYTFSSWSDGVSTASRTDTAQSSDINVRADFTINTYTINLDYNDEYGSVSATANEVQHGDTVEIQITPNDDYNVANVLGCFDGSFNADTNTYTSGEITGACTVSVTFSLITYTINATALEGGSVNQTSANVPHGGTATFIFTPDDGYIINSVTGCGGTLSENTYTTAEINETNASCSVEASFVLADTSPNAFTFASVIGTPNANQRSETITVSGINTGTSISVSEGLTYRIGDDEETPFTSNSGQINPGETLTLSMPVPEFYHSTYTATITVGDYSTDFSVITQNRPDYDLDNDGLIEINRLEDLSEIRNHLNGDGLYGQSTGCPSTGCIGFELTRDLDFDRNNDGKLNGEDPHWDSGRGWAPIGSSETPFTASFDGNGLIIRNLFVYRPAEELVGLFASISDASVSQLALTGPHSRVIGGNQVGAITGAADSSTLTAIYTSVSVEAASNSYNIYAGGVAGGSEESIYSSIIISSYIHSTGSSAGIIGSSGRNDLISSSYSTSNVNSIKGERSTNGLLSINFFLGGQVENSYWAIDSSPNTESDEFGVSLSDLKCWSNGDNSSCTVVDLSSWTSSNYWTFGTNQQLPALSMGGRIYRDNDADGALNNLADGTSAGDDQWPETFAVSYDYDQDGQPDRWTPSCDEDCINDAKIANGFEFDHFSRNASFARDNDWDGIPDAWNSGCEPLNQQEQCDNPGSLFPESGNMLANTDNDNLPNSSDDDDNGDGITDADSDSDGYIDIENLAQLNAMRFELAGKGRRQTEGGSLDVSGCPASITHGFEIQGCNGYELFADLNFDSDGDGSIDPEYWNEGEGWSPVGSSYAPFTGNFKGNGHRIDNLYINRPRSGQLGLFGEVNGAEIKEIALSGNLARVTGNSANGSVAGSTENSTLIAIYSSVPVNNTSLGIAHYNTSSGGLFGIIRNSRLSASMYTGYLGESNFAQGGLVGAASYSVISSSYSTAFINSTHSRSGGLTASSSTSTISSSFWTTDHTNNATSDDGGTGVTIAELQCWTDGSSNFGCVAPLTGWQDHVDEEGNPYWIMGDRTQLPALSMGGRIFRDNDGDGALNDLADGISAGDDTWPNIYAASLDKDGDGYLDRWTLGCDELCREDAFLAEGFIYDHFPNNESFAIDDDRDGLPDTLNTNCLSSSCSNPGNLQAEDTNPNSFVNDTDNDGTPNEDDEDDNNSSPGLNADRDRDGLIDITTLDELNAMRNNLNGTSLILTEGGSGDSSGCTGVVIEGYETNLCKGYELLNDLNFDSNGDGQADAPYQNWAPIGYNSNTQEFSAIFEGNGFEIQNLNVDNNPRGPEGLFSVTYYAEIKNVALTGPHSRVFGSAAVGSLIGWAEFTNVAGVISTVPVESTSSTASAIGGLIGTSYDSNIEASAFTGTVTVVGYEAGGLVGDFITGSINASFSTGSISSASTDSRVGGLVGYAGETATVESSYWTTDTSGQDSSAAGTGVLLSQLQCWSNSTSNSGCTAAPLTSWENILDEDGNALWDFGTSSQLPGINMNGVVIRDSDGDGTLD